MDDGVEHQYLMTEGYLWTSIYEEAKRIIEHGNNQSMELNEENLKGSWATDENGWPTFFIINEAMIQKLCILGEDVEPCFEGAGIAAQFSLDENFKNKLFSEIENMKNALSKGGVNPMDEENKVLDPEVDTEFKKKNPEEEEEEKKDAPADSEEDAPAEDDKGEDESSEDEDEDEKKKKAKHSLEDITSSEEYISLLNDYNALNDKYTALENEANTLRAFKAAKDKEAKQAMIDSFYMLSDAEKADVVNNIDSYSVDDIEAKLSIICVRNKVSFNLDENQNNDSEHKEEPLVYELDSHDDGDSVPAWIKAVRETAKNL